ncbi:MAG: hypothetical protein NXH83_05815 [Rhodobacteraceae bacterium]|jgi:hypothetical protein|nr:hypothetical protein [Paracoccaceae bacterium]
MTPAQIEQLFTRSDGSFLCARWGRPVVPVVFGVAEETLGILKGAVEAVVALAGHAMAETDPELGANYLVFFCRDWEELLAVPDLDRLVEGLAPLVARLNEAGANQYRVFRFDTDGAIRACFAFVRMDGEMQQVPAEVLALNQAVQMILLWSDRAFAEVGPLARAPGGEGELGRVILRPDIAEVIRAAYDPVLPAAAQDASHALRLAARASRLS